MEDRPKISILVATNDHPPDLDCFFDGLITQTLPSEDFECVVVDASRTHDYEQAYERALRRKDPRLRLHYEPIARGGRASAYNRGLPLCRAPLILFFGGDYLAGPQTAAVHLRFHQENPDRCQVGVGVALLIEELRTHFSIWAEESGELFGVPFSRSIESVPENFFYIGNTSVKRDLLLQAGPFDEDFRFHAWDDFELGLRLTQAGMKAMYLPEATAQHVHDLSLDERCRGLMDAGQCAVVFERKYQGVHGWHARCRIPPWQHRVAAAGSRLRFALTRREQHLVDYYRHRLDAAFVMGYRLGDGR
jgi:GT2 family glycosyltransferase